MLGFAAVKTVTGEPTFTAEKLNVSGAVIGEVAKPNTGKDNTILALGVPPNSAAMLAIVVPV